MNLHPRTGLSRRRLVMASAGSAAVATLVACAPGAQGPPSASAETVQLRLHGSTSGAEGDYWPKVESGFNAKHSNVKVTFEPWAPDKGVFVLGAAGALGDVMRLVGSGDYAQVAAKALLKDLAPFVAHDKYDLKQFYSAAVETLKFRGKQFGLPHIAHPGFCGQFMNLDFVKQAGLREPDDSAWTFSDYQAILKQLTPADRDGSRWGLWPPTSIQHVTVAARAFGGNTLSPDGKRSLVADPASAQGIQFLADLVLKDRSAAAPGVLEGTDVQNFASGKTAAEWTNFGVINTLNKQAQGVQWKVFMGPKGPTSRGFFLGVDAAAMGGTTKNPDAAFELVKYIVSKEVSLGWFDFGFAPGGRPDTWNDPKVAADPAFKVFARAMPEAAPLILPDNGLTTDYNSAVNKELANVWNGKTNLKDGVEAARRAGQQVLDQQST